MLDEAAASESGRLTPFYQSLVAGFLILFLCAGWAYGASAGTVKNHRDIVRMMTESTAEMAYYLVLSFAAAHFVAMFAWSNLGLIFAVLGAEAIAHSGLSMPVLFVLLVTGLLMTFGWVWLDLPLGPHAGVDYTAPAR